MTFDLQLYHEQAEIWPRTGRHILGQFDEASIVVYQAYRPEIADFAVAHQRFGGAFSYNRMSWIKPNFLWMMCRSGWAAKEGQERILAVRLPRVFFDEILEKSVASSFGASGCQDHETWQRSVAHSEVRLQWDPDHNPQGHPVPRRAMQLGLRGAMLRRYGESELLSVEDITDYVTTQRQNLESGRINQLLTPAERVYQPSNPAAAAAVGISL